jgi:hypothetical protein
MDPDSDENLGPLRPGFVHERALDGHGRRDGVRRAAEGDEERIAGRIDLIAAVRRERLSNQGLVPGEQIAVAFAADLLEERGRTLDVREQEGDRAAQTLRREPPSGERPAVPISCQVT